MKIVNFENISRRQQITRHAKSSNQFLEFSGAPRLNNIQRKNAVMMLQAGKTQGQVAAVFGVSRRTIMRLWRRFNVTGSVIDTIRTPTPPPQSPPTL